MRFPHDPPLLALAGATAEWYAGTPPSCSASVRLLDQVHFTVYPGDCVVVHHNDPAGACVLLAALAGNPALAVSRRLRGERYVAPRVRIRRCSISANALPHILEGWRELRDDMVGVPAPSPHAPEPVVHLLRASRLSVVTGHEAHQWRVWARRQRLNQGAVVAVARPQPVRTVSVVPDGPPATVASQLREADGAAYNATGDHTATRGVWLRFGRLFALQEWQ